MDKPAKGLDNRSYGDLDSLRDMALFVAVAEYSGFTAAAKKLDLPTSTVSWRISEYEQGLGVKLFNRTTRRVELTSDGVLHLQKCRQIVLDARKVTEDIKLQSGAPRGRIRVSTTADFAIRMLAPVLPDFTRRFPDIHLDIDTTANRVDLLSENVDVAIRMGSLPDSAMVARKLFDAHLNLYASPAYLQAYGTPLSPNDLPQHQCIKAGPVPGEFTWKLLQGEGIAEITLVPHLWANNMGLARELMIQGMGITLLVEEVFAQDIRAGRAVRVLPDWCFSTTNVAVVVPQRDMSTKTRVFIDFLIEKFKDVGNPGFAA